MVYELLKDQIFFSRSILVQIIGFPVDWRSDYRSSAVFSSWHIFERCSNYSLNFSDVSKDNHRKFVKIGRIVFDFTGNRYNIKGIIL